MRYESYNPNEVIGPQLLKAAEARAKTLQGHYSPNLGPFMDPEVYGKEAVLKDLQYVIKCNKAFTAKDTSIEADRKRVSDVFETYFVDAANVMKWFGEETEISPTAKYDDYKNKVDIVATFTDNDRPDHLALSTDLTYGTGASAEKFYNIIDDIEKGKMASLRYFHSEHMGYTGRLTGVPKTIIGLDKTNVAEFIRLWTHDTDNPDVSTYRNILLTQFMDQLHFFTTLADKHHGESQIRRRYSRAYNIVRDIWQKNEIDRYSLPPDSITNQIYEMS
jgi:hypothetical protein